MRYIIAKVEKKNKLNLKHEIILCQKETKSKMFQVNPALHYPFN